MSASSADRLVASPERPEHQQGQGFHRRRYAGRRWRLTGVLPAVVMTLSALWPGASMAQTVQSLPEVERFPAEGGLTHAEDGVILPDGRLLVGDWNHGLVTIAPDGTIAPFGDFAAAGFKTKTDPLWNSPNGIAWEPDGRHVLVADITGGHIYRVDTGTQAVARIYDHPFGVNAAIRDPSGAIWFTQSTENEAGAGSEGRMFAAADRPMGDGSVWRISPKEVGKPAPRAVKLVDGLDFANGIVFDAARGRLYVAEIVASRVLSFAVDPATGALTDRRVLARVTTPDNLELAADGMLWAASPFANAIYRIDPDNGVVGTVFNPDPAKSARMVAQLERRQAAGEPLLPMLLPDLWAPMPGLVTGVILPPGGGPAYVSGLGDALIRFDASAQSAEAGNAISALTDLARDYAAAWSSQNPASVAAFYGESGRLTVNGGEPAIGRAAISDVARGFMEAFPDMTVAFDRMGADGGRQVFHWTLTGTNTGPGGTGARVEISGAEAWLIGPDGLIADSVGAFDAANYSRQLAFLKPDAQTNGASIALAIASAAAAQTVDPVTNAQQLEQAIAQSHRALEAILNGDPSLYLALFADREDITLGNPFGPFGQGRAAVAATLANAANKYQRGTARVERVAQYGDANIVCLVEIEHDRAQLSGRDDYSEFSVRVTSIYERIGGQWKLVHRHADPITTARSAQSVIGK